MSGTPDVEKYMMHIAISHEPHGKVFDGLGIFAFLLTYPNGKEDQMVCADTEPVRMDEDEDCHFSAILLLLASQRLPEGSHLEVITTQQHYHGNGTANYPGLLNQSREERRANEYLNPKAKWQPYAASAQLKRMDDELEARGITLSARPASTPADKGKVGRMKAEAIRMLDRAQVRRSGEEPSSLDAEGL